jgi:hypothetical protein
LTDLHDFLHSLELPLIQSQVVTLAAFVIGAVLANSCHLPQIAAYMPLPLAQRYRLQRLERFLQSKKVKPMDVMAPIARWLLRRAAAVGPIKLVLDFTTNRDQHLIAMVSLIWGKRTLPLAWAVGQANTKGVSRRALAQQAVGHVAAWVPDDTNVTFIGDREFRGRPWRKLMKQLRWHFVLRLSADRTFAHFPDGSVCRLRDLGTQPGDACYWSGVYLTVQRDGPYNLAAVWDPQAEEPWLLITDLDPQQAVALYRERWSIESSFRDFKSYGFDLEQSRIEELERFECLLLGLALAYGWCVRIGQWLIDSGQRLLVDRGRQQKLSSYRLGRYRLVYLLSIGSDELAQLYFAHVPP